MPNKVVKHRYASLHWTEFKLRLCGFAAQTIPQSRNLNSAVYHGVRFL
jgi:hypothetical protein